MKPHDPAPGMEILAGFTAALATGAIRIIDLTQTLGPDFPSIVMPPEIGQSRAFRMEEISRYDERGGAWYWNNLSFGEHTGTHFDAPIHWVSGRDLPNSSTDTIPVDDLISNIYHNDINLSGVEGDMTNTAEDTRTGTVALSAHGLGKRFGDRVAFDDISLEIGYGEIFGFLGPNGAGKTTTVRTLGTLIAPTSGSAEVAGIPLTQENGTEIRRRISIMPEAPGLYLRLSVTENPMLRRPVSGARSRRSH